jgi:hypothetical protein
VTPEHALNEHASWILIHQRSRPVMCTYRTLRDVRLESGMRTKADVGRPFRVHGFTPLVTPLEIRR